VASWLQQHLELQRYKDLTDLDNAELQRLLQSADTQARDLLATLAIFRPHCSGKACRAPLAAQPVKCC